MSLLQTIRESNQPEYDESSGTVEGEDTVDEAQPAVPAPMSEGRILRKMRHKLRRYPHLWVGSSFDIRDSTLLFGPSADFIDYSRLNGSCHLAKICHYKAGEDHIAETQTFWTSENNALCNLMISTCGATAYGFPRLIWLKYPDELKEYHIRVDIKIMLSTIAMTRYNVSWGILSTRPDKIRILHGPKIFSPKHSWDAMILRDCTVTAEGELRKSPEIATRRWDVLLMKMGWNYSYPWLPVSIQDAGPFVDPTTETTRCFPGIFNPHPTINPQ
ncbi:uncharacterized protein GGS22DRAFT_188105 [Annulohypoxylon maeteangense]|uniref:uncharacterized protein n=1 Tax=Annulohypoxylon maeteangense TaxID=1927788 RepID=UPI002007F1CF|nr:uncharacterized protein GGS22DRAFT_188105 [Annulohypoxylon maeteangense]KAI0885818.1 hypothetical protein GGS22DRAFT_188105 [Annulohypoxylon maeteangense]